MSISINSLIFGGGYAEGAGNLTSGKPLSDGRIDKIDPSSSAKIRKEVKWLNVNNTDIPTLVTALTAKTIGSNITTQVVSPNETFNREAESLIEQHNKIGVGELTNKHHFNGAMRTVSDFVQMEGGILIRHHYNLAWTIPYKYELISVDMIDIKKRAELPQTEEKIVNGIVYNNWNQPIAYYLYTNEDRRESVRVSSEDVTYYSEVWASVGQQLAISKFVRLLTTLDRTAIYEDAELQSATEEAKAGGYLKSTAFAQIMNIIYEQIEQQTGTIQDKLSQLDQINAKLSKLGIKPSGLTPIPETDDVIFNSSKRDSIYSDINGNSITKMASSQGLSHISAYGKADKANYSAIKFSAESDALQAEIRFDDISNKVINEINRRLINVGVQIGLISDRAKYWANPTAYVKFRYIRKVNIDIEPSKNATADKTNLENGTVTKGQLIEKKHGIKKEDFWKMKIQEEIEEEKLRQELYAKAGITITPVQENIQ